MNKNILKSIFLIGTSALFAGCADTDIDPYSVEQPHTSAEYAYLNDYGPLKSYIDRNAYPNFKLATAVSASEFNSYAIPYRLAIANGDEVVTGNAFKYASCVANDGTMYFSTVTAFTDNAVEAGLSPYGHTLVWHSQQNNTYLAGLIADKPIPQDPTAASNSYLAYSCGEAGTNRWDKQAIYTLPKALEIGKTYKLRIDIKAFDAANIAADNLKCQIYCNWDASPNRNQWGGTNDVDYSEDKTLSGDWATYEWTLTPTKFIYDKLCFSFGTLSGIVGFDNFVITEAGSETNIVENGDFAEASTSAWTNNWNGPSFEIASESSSSSMTNNYIEYTSTGTDASNTWDNQAIYTLGFELEQGVSYTLSVDIKGSNSGKCAIWPLWNASSNKNQWGGSNDVLYMEEKGFNASWQTITWNINSANFPLDCIQFVFGKYGGKIAFDNLVLTKDGTDKNLLSNGDFSTASTDGWSSNWNGPSFELVKESLNTIPLTDEEKKDTLTWALDNWIKGIMNATGGKVKAWDVVNEPIGGSGDDGEGNYALQHASNPDDNGVGGDAFYWQDYLGDLDFVRIAVKKARQYFEEAGGDPSELKLFVNDYNLESDWDDNKKVKSMINWVKKWESDGVTKIDGIGTQMHISCYANEATQQSKKEHITKMFELLAASGKLIRVSELDMGYIDENGNNVLTVDMTEDKHHAMADLYKFVVSEYLRIIPADQQWGICNWGVTDSPTTSGWRAGQPIGLWDLDYRRKHTYAGFADGLAGKE